MDNELLYRSVSVEREGVVDEEARTIELSFSSETPVERAFGNEVLDHGPEHFLDFDSISSHWYFFPFLDAPRCLILLVLRSDTTRGVI